MAAGAGVDGVIFDIDPVAPGTFKRPMMKRRRRRKRCLRCLGIISDARRKMKAQFCSDNCRKRQCDG